jgi:hypothetical protein
MKELEDIKIILAYLVGTCLEGKQMTQADKMVLLATMNKLGLTIK